MNRIQVGVIGAAAPTKDQAKTAEELGRAIAGEGWLLINGGLGGVMEASASGAVSEGGEVIGVLPTGKKTDANRFVTIPIVTNMGHARNVIIVQSSDACVAVAGGEGTLSEIAIALKEGKIVVGLCSWNIPGMRQASSVPQAIEIIKSGLGIS